MPVVPVHKFTFSSLKLRAKVLILSLLGITLTFSAYAGLRLYTSIQASREQQAYADAMTQADNFSKSGRPQNTVVVLESYLKTNHPLTHRANAMSTLAYAYVQNHQDDKAFSEFQQIDNLHLQPPSIYVLRSLAWYYLNHNDKAKAITYYRRAIAAAQAKYDPEATPYIPQWQAQLKQLEAM